MQFEQIPELKNAQLGAFWSSLDTNKWCIVEDATFLPPQFERFEDSTQWHDGLQLRLKRESACRLQIKNHTQDRMIQVQNSRFHFNWLGKSGGKYPRYREVFGEFEASLKKFQCFLEEGKIGAIQPNQWEITYVNHIPLGSVWHNPREWDFFKLIKSDDLSGELVASESLEGNWRFVIPPEKGRLHIHWQHVVGTNAGDQNNEFIRLVFTARGAIEDGIPEAVAKGLALGRKTIVSSFKELMSDKANQYWGLKCQ
ncbi:MAG: hypothetical protein JKY95_12210 [Planctomycetaceae bacterium]|nr:hypothetical protein [Planctomycetaceae bacterium]